MADHKNDMEPGEIERYRNGTMSEAERHALEKRALSDPFLADALEGAEHIPAETFSTDVIELSAKISSAKSTSWFTPLRIAAGILVMVAGGSLIYFFDTPPPEPLAMEKAVHPAAGPDTAALPRKDSSSSLLSLAKPEEPVAKKADASGKQKAEPKTGTAAGQLASGGGEIQKPVEQPGIHADEVADKADLVETEVDEQKKEEIAPARNLASAPAVADRKAARARDSYSLSTGKLAGRVISSEDGSPLPGVNVIVKGTNSGTVTDADGKFMIFNPTPNTQLVISFIGLQTREVRPVENVPLEIKMDSDTRQLSEVVVSGYSVSEKDEAMDDARAFEFAVPEGGRSAFQKYLQSNLQYPAKALAGQTEGKVTVQFTVTAEGQLTNFTILKGIGDGCDEELIRLIQHGPPWSPSRRNNVPVEDKARVRLRFSLPR